MSYLDRAAEVFASKLVQEAAENAAVSAERIRQIRESQAYARGQIETMFAQAGVDAGAVHYIQPGDSGDTAVPDGTEFIVIFSEDSFITLSRPKPGPQCAIRFWSHDGEFKEITFHTWYRCAEDDTADPPDRFYVQPAGYLEQTKDLLVAIGAMLYYQAAYDAAADAAMAKNIDAALASQKEVRKPTSHLEMARRFAATAADHALIAIAEGLAEMNAVAENERLRAIY